MKVAIFGSSQEVYATKRIQEELHKQNIPFDFLNHKKIIYTEKNIFLEGAPLDLSQYTIAFFRTTGYTVNDLPFTFRADNELNILKSTLQKYNIPFINSEIIEKYPLYNKFTQSQIFRAYDILTPQTIHINNNDPDEILNMCTQLHIDFPVVLKKSSGSQGGSVFLINSFMRLKKALYEERNINYILQEFIPNTEDYRVFFINGKSAGIMKRSGGSDWRNNYSLGGSIEKHENSDMERFVEDICNRIGFDNAGVDIIMQDGKFCVLEINLTPGFEGFEKANDINIAKLFVDMLKEKSN